MIEVEEVIRVDSSHQPVAPMWCSACGSDAPMVTPDQAATIVRSSVRAVNRSVEAGRVHFVETAEGRLFVCVNSLDLGATETRFVAVDRARYLIWPF